MTNFTNYQRDTWKSITIFGICPYYIDRDKDNPEKYVIKSASKTRLAFYYFLWLNSAVKVIYLILTYRGFLLPVGFLDQMTMWDYFLCYSQVVQEINMWYRKYTMYEVLHANWTVQEDIFRKLGSPQHLQKYIMKSDRTLVWLHTIMCILGPGALLVQYFADPKYVLFTYSIIPWDTWPLRILFAIHEHLSMFHIGTHQTASLVVVEMFAVTYTQILKEMVKVMYQLIDLGEDIPENLLTEVRKSAQQTESIEARNANGFREKLDELNINHRSSKRENIHKIIEIKRKKMKLETVVPGTTYDITTLLKDYKRVMVATNSFNNWVGKCMAGTTASNYSQFVSDVFNMIQLLKEPNVDFMGVFFFFEDACAGMVMLFRMLILMSKLYPVSDNFLKSFKDYLQYDMPQKKYLLKYQATLHIVAAKLGGYKTRPITVPNGINVLMNWYICAAMWHRPVDRLT